MTPSHHSTSEAVKEFARLCLPGLLGYPLIVVLIGGVVPGLWALLVVWFIGLIGVVVALALGAWDTLFCIVFVLAIPRAPFEML